MCDEGHWNHIATMNKMFKFGTFDILYTEIFIEFEKHSQTDYSGK